MSTYLLTNLNFENSKSILNLDLDEDFNNILDKSLLKNLGMNYAIVYSIDNVYVGSIDNLSIDNEKFIEARFFNELSELKIWKNENELKASYFKELDNAEYVEESYFIYKDVKLDKNVNKIKVRKYLDFDAESQCYISYMKPVDFVLEREWKNEIRNYEFKWPQFKICKSSI